MEIYHTINVLIVDDEPNQLELLRYNLKQANFNVTSSDNGEKALEIAEDILPDIIIWLTTWDHPPGLEPKSNKLVSFFINLNFLLSSINLNEALDL